MVGGALFFFNCEYQALNKYVLDCSFCSRSFSLNRAQSIERLLCKREVLGSLASSTTSV